MASAMNCWLLCTALVAVPVTGGCENKPSESLAPTASALEAPKPPAAGAQSFKLDPASSKLDFTMDAELEKIFGRAPGAVEGELFVDPKDVTKSTGLVKLDLDKLSIYQRKRESADKEFGEEVKHEKQNKDMRTWFEIEPDAPAEVREKNRWVEFKIDKVENASTKDVSALSGAERKVTLTVSGDFRLHQRVTKKSAKLEVTFKYEGDKPVELRVKTQEPFGIGLEEHDVRPRSAFSKLADKGLDALGAKVAKVAMVSLEFGAK
jgi:polyisoprenoid-binding protein YceI